MIDIRKPQPPTEDSEICRIFGLSRKELEFMGKTIGEYDAKAVEQARKYQR